MLLFFLALLGIFDAGYLSYLHATGNYPPCEIGSLFDCGKVLQSQYSVLFGIPVAYLGLLHYGLLWLWIFLALNFESKIGRYFIILQAWAGLIFSLYFSVLQVFVLQAFCLYCMGSVVISTTVFLLANGFLYKERKQLAIWGIGYFYRLIIKPLCFKIDPELVHTRMVRLGQIIGSSPFFTSLLKWLLTVKQPELQQTIAGLNFAQPVGLAAGFDYEAKLTQSLAPIGFGFQTVGTITHSSYEGNPRPMLGRLPRSKSLMVNKGFKNLGAAETIKCLQGLQFAIPVGISIGRTNSLKLKTQAASVQDIVKTFKQFKAAKLPHAYYELNISCPNLFGTITFYPPKNLEALLKAVDALKLSRPVFVKMPIEKSDVEVTAMLRVIIKHNIQGVIFGNLQKNRQDSALQSDEVAQFKSGNFSGKPTFKRSNELIKLAYEQYGNRLIIIGCGGIFSAKDAYHKIKLGASLVQLITGMIYEGPQLIAQINLELSQLLAKDGYVHISQAVGVHAKTRKKRR